MIKERIKLRFEKEEDLKACVMVAEKQGYTLEQLVHLLLHKEVTAYLREAKEKANEGNS